MIPAYGRDYKNIPEVIDAWESGKDFMISDVSSVHDGRYCNRFDIRMFNYDEISFRYNKLRKIYIYSLEGKNENSTNNV